MRSLKIILAAAIVVLDLSCGLPNPYFLAAPTASLATGGSTATFYSPGYNVGSPLTTFSGFDIYYKFLTTTPSGTDINLGGGGFPGPSILQQNGYYPICLSTDNPPFSRTAPAIAIAFADSQTALTITLTIGSSGASFTSYQPTLNLGRYVSYTSPSQSKWFAGDSTGFPSPALSPQNYPQNGEADGSPSWTSVTSGQVFVNLYVVAYGYEAGTTILQYSTPTYLGYVTIAPFPG